MIIMIICAAIALGAIILTQAGSENQSQAELVAIPVRVSENNYPNSRITRL